jgi:hypothetical protein
MIGSFGSKASAPIASAVAPRMKAPKADLSALSAPAPVAPKPDAGFRSKLSDVKTDRGAFQFKANRGAAKPAGAPKPGRMPHNPKKD